jgi:hypothetical protein
MQAHCFFDGIRLEGERVERGVGYKTIEVKLFVRHLDQFQSYLLHATMLFYKKCKCWDLHTGNNTPFVK